VCHAARQTTSGQWTSKLGELDDIEHRDPFVLEKDYGAIRQFLSDQSPIAEIVQSRRGFKFLPYCCCPSTARLVRSCPGLATSPAGFLPVAKSANSWVRPSRVWCRCYLWKLRPGAQRSEDIPVHFKNAGRCFLNNILVSSACSHNSRARWAKPVVLSQPVLARSQARRRVGSRVKIFPDIGN
jgi:hypothetical protein